MDFKVADRFGRSVLDRFRNPFINHKLIDITVQYTTKMRMRNVPLLVNYYKEFGKAPELFAMGFAAYLQFMQYLGSDFVKISTPISLKGNLSFEDVAAWAAERSPFPVIDGGRTWSLATLLPLSEIAFNTIIEATLALQLQGDYFEEEITGADDW
jgi:hypothetical protein